MCDQAAQRLPRSESAFCDGRSRAPFLLPLKAPAFPVTVMHTPQSLELKADCPPPSPSQEALQALARRRARRQFAAGVGSA